MKELIEYRRKLVERFLETAREFRATCLAGKDLHAPLEAGWSLHQIAVHTRDVNRLVYGARIRQTAEEDNPEFPNFDGNAYLAEHYDADEALNEVLDRLVEDTQSVVELLKKLPAEAWSRLSRHATLGNGLTLQGWVEKGLAHIEEHLDTVKNTK
jgi:hypothetical protein